ncbi:hypothetical protein AB4Y44_29140 [Paraburkholderia sp. BR10937]|uniref:hypothetical protein n=1 Tax=Paraburkholderia sp. BR10937 TaxID=3236994 RepID=UPI0034D2ECB9
MMDKARIPEPICHGESDVEPFETYFERWPAEYSHVPPSVVETWIYRHWRDFQWWLPLRPLEWAYELKQMSSSEILTISHVGSWPETLRFWGDDLFEGKARRTTWLGRAMLTTGTTPAPMIVARDAGRYGHPREANLPFLEPYQLIEDHMRLAYLQSMIRHGNPQLRSHHEVIVATLPTAIKIAAT